MKSHKILARSKQSKIWKISTSKRSSRYRGKLRPRKKNRTTTYTSGDQFSSTSPRELKKNSPALFNTRPVPFCSPFFPPERRLSDASCLDAAICVSCSLSLHREGFAHSPRHVLACAHTRSHTLWHTLWHTIRHTIWHTLSHKVQQLWHALAHTEKAKLFIPFFLAPLNLFAMAFHKSGGNSSTQSQSACINKKTNKKNNYHHMSSMNLPSV